VASEQELIGIGMLGFICLLVSAHLLFRTCGYSKEKGRRKARVAIIAIASYALTLVLNALSNNTGNPMIDAFRTNVAVFFGLTGIVAIGLCCVAVAEEILAYLGRASLSSALSRAAPVFANNRLAWTATGIVFVQNILPAFIYSGILAQSLAASMANGLLRYTPNLVSLLLLYLWIGCIWDAYSFTKKPAKDRTAKTASRQKEKGAAATGAKGTSV